MNRIRPEIIWMCAIGGSLALALSLQQRTFFLFSKVTEYRDGATLLTCGRTESWGPSLVSAAILLSAAVFLPAISKRMMRWSGVALVLWTAFGYFYVYFPPGRGFVVFPDRWWHMGVPMRLRLDPTYSLTILLGILQAALSIYLILHSFSWHRPGFCRQCDYDLTGNVSGTCPECGSAVLRQHGDSTASTLGEENVRNGEIEKGHH